MLRTDRTLEQRNDQGGTSAGRKLTASKASFLDTTPSLLHKLRKLHIPYPSLFFAMYSRSDVRRSEPS